MRTRLQPFYPPRPCPPVRWTVGALAPWILRAGWGIARIEMADAELQRLRSLRRERALFVANHPTLAEPGVLFALFHRAGLRCHLLTAWDTMVHFGALSAAFFQCIGAYSVMRGRQDRASLAASRELLARGERILVFPEGQTYGLADRLQPFQPGVALIAFQALEAMAERGIDARLLRVPAAIRYVFVEPMEAKIEAALARVEAALALPPEPLDPVARIERVAEARIAALAAETGVPGEGRSPEELRKALRAALAERVAAALDAELPREREPATVAQALAAAYHQRIARERLGEPVAGAAIAEVRRLYLRWQRLRAFAAVGEGYVRELRVPERFAEVLRLLEADLLGKSRLRGLCAAHVRIGEPADLRPLLSEDRQQRREALREATRRLEAEVRALLESLVAERRAGVGGATAS